MTTDTTVLISGAGIAGPSLAHWLRRFGFVPTVVEQAPGLRDSGGAVDFRGAQVEVLRRMDILAAVQAQQTAMGAQVVIDGDGEPLVNLPSAFFSGEVEIERGDLARILYDLTRDTTEYVFGDSITSLAETTDGVDVTFRHGAPRTFDLVVGADGMHSAVRRLAFGDESRFRQDMGYCFAGFTAPNHLGLDHSGVIYNVPGRGALVSSSRDSSRAGVGFVFAAPESPYARHDQAEQKRIVADAFAGAGWRTDALVELMHDADDLYFDSLSQIHLDSWSRGRVVLLGDAAWCAGPGGSGTGLAMIGAYVLAGELVAAPGDHGLAFARYEERLRPGAELGQKQAKGAGPFLAPPTERKIRRRNRFYKLLSSRLLAGAFNRLTAGAANSVPVPDYPEPVALVAS
ncbi:2-polyprenyl-6-methoxyphenol hydroxylase-like FAD-dependent oxidoreductase [Kitasatospora sp. GAS204A]|uniref:FAD-dependent monooxygenase n=1 Tax=unclassified Kitasatospora TaxID=2633591 RepID=UPI00247556FF|nr:FAD-dependent monooxygenase [Kitasatospora sp. GAS204B]MDH6118030.1 2-polyprenyl-6-methoxyphenol hydroxylase-like FAD-dependent oxidoreductase [Kitasatospora sp. GAS204B]